MTLFEGWSACLFSYYYEKQQILNKKNQQISLIFINFYFANNEFMPYLQVVYSPLSLSYGKIELRLIKKLRVSIIIGIIKFTFSYFIFIINQGTQDFN